MTATGCIGFAPRETKSPSKNHAQPTLVVRLQTPEEKLIQFAERAQLALWLIGSAPSIEAVALAENIYERAFEGARSLGHRLAVRPTVEGWRLVPTPLPRMKRRAG
jgi:hypothetical protein